MAEAMSLASYHAVRHVPLPELNVVRLPGEAGPILRCCGELSAATTGLLEQELTLLEPLDHPALILNLTGCDFLDVDGMLTLLDSFRRRRERGSEMVVVAGSGQPARLLRVTGISEMIPVFPSEEVAALALRGGGAPRPAVSSWEAAREMAVALWHAIAAVLDTAPRDDILYHLTSMTALCERSEEIFQERAWETRDRPGLASTSASRCQFCPLFQALGGRPEDVGCRSLLDPIIEAVRTQNRDAARKQVAAVIRILEEMALPGNDRVMT